MFQTQCLVQCLKYNKSPVNSECHQCLRSLSILWLLLTHNICCCTRHITWEACIRHKISDCSMHEQLVIIIGINTPRSLILKAFPFILKDYWYQRPLSCPLSSYQYANYNLFCLVLSKQGLKKPSTVHSQSLHSQQWPWPFVPPVSTSPKLGFQVSVTTPGCKWRLFFSFWLPKTE